MSSKMNSKMSSKVSSEQGSQKVEVEGKDSSDAESSNFEFLMSSLQDEALSSLGTKGFLKFSRRFPVVTRSMGSIKNSPGQVPGVLESSDTNTVDTASSRNAERYGKVTSFNIPRNLVILYLEYAVSSETAAFMRKTSSKGGLAKLSTLYNNVINNIIDSLFNVWVSSPLYLGGHIGGEGFGFFVSEYILSCVLSLEDYSTYKFIKKNLSK